MHAGSACGFDADDLRIGADVTENARNAGSEPAASDREQQEIYVTFSVVQYIEPDSSLSFDDQRVVERLDVTGAFGFAKPPRLVA
jgi:hypothetical protein